jgi:hypothetical protein
MKLKEIDKLKMKRIKQVFILYSSGHTPKEIAKIMELPFEIIRFWIGSTYFYELKNKPQEEPTQSNRRQVGFSNWVSEISNRHMKVLKKANELKKAKKKILKKAS